MVFSTPFHSVKVPYRVPGYSKTLNDYILVFNPLWPSDSAWRHKSGSTLAQVMACCLTAPSHYLNQCWLIMSEDLWQSPDGNFTRGLKIAYLKFPSNLQGANELTHLHGCHRFTPLHKIPHAIHDSLSRTPSNYKFISGDCHLSVAS